MLARISTIDSTFALESLILAFFHKIAGLRQMNSRTPNLKNSWIPPTDSKWDSSL